jgi:hypothetical protein
MSLSRRWATGAAASNGVAGVRGVEMNLPLHLEHRSWSSVGDGPLRPPCARDPRLG